MVPGGGGGGKGKAIRCERGERKRGKGREGGTRMSEGGGDIERERKEEREVKTQ